jgi:hypothetical protein
MMVWLDVKTGPGQASWSVYLCDLGCLKYAFQWSEWSRKLVRFDPVAHHQLHDELDAK